MSFSSRLQTIAVKRNWMNVLEQLLRFSIVGGINTCVDVLAFNALMEAFPSHQVYQLVLYNSLAYLIGALNSFCWNKFWTFEQHSKVTRGQVIRFACVTGLGILCNDLLLWLATILLTTFSTGGLLWANVAKISAIAGTMTLSFVGMRFAVFIEGGQERVTIPPPVHPHMFIRPRSLSVVLPAYNEEVVIAHTIMTIVAALDNWLHDFEVIVINDGSKDRTGEIIARLSAQEPRVRLIHHPANRGYGAALVTGFEAVTKEMAFFMDADGQFDIHDLARFFPLIEEFDAVLGYRIDRQDTAMRKLNAWCWKQLVRIMFGIRVRDIDCAFKLYRAEFFRRHRLETRGAMINTEMIYKFARAGYIYTEVGVRHLPRRTGQATGAKPAVIIGALHEMFLYAGKWRQQEQQHG